MQNQDTETKPSALLTCLGPAGQCRWPACTRKSTPRPRYPVTRAND